MSKKQMPKKKRTSKRKKLPDYLKISDTWHNKPGRGRYHKRSVSKAERRYIKNLLEHGVDNPRSLAKKISTVKWKGT